jgi:hypothetical protein
MRRVIRREPAGPQVAAEETPELPLELFREIVAGFCHRCTVEALRFSSDADEHQGALDQAALGSVAASAVHSQCSV